MAQYNPCKDCERRTVNCHGSCEDYAALRADNAARRAYIEAHRSTDAADLRISGRLKRQKHYMRLKRR